MVFIELHQAGYGGGEVVSEFRKNRIEKLLEELKYEITRGMMEGEIDETIGFRWIVPISKQIPEGVVHCIMETRPVHRHSMMMFDANEPPRLRLVKK